MLISTYVNCSTVFCNIPNQPAYLGKPHAAGPCRKLETGASAAAALSGGGIFLGWGIGGVTSHHMVYQRLSKCINIFGLFEFLNTIDYRISHIKMIW